MISYIYIYVSSFTCTLKKINGLAHINIVVIIRTIPDEDSFFMKSAIKLIYNPNIYYQILSYHILAYLILSYLILSYLILSYLILSYLISSYLIQKSNLGFLLNNTKIEYEIFRKGDIKGEIGKFIFSYGRDDLDKTSIINHLIHKYKFNNYLEIGVGDGLNYNNIKIKNKVGVDPNQSKECNKNIYLMTSDEYFEYIENENLKFDMIFIDGLKLDYQVTKDIHNSLKHLSSNGFIILLNCNPLKKIYQRNTFAEGGVYLPWNGTTWRSYVNLRMNEPNLNMSVLNTCWGMGIISNGKQKCYPKKDPLKFSDLNNDRLNMLNLISIYEFLIKY